MAEKKSVAGAEASIPETASLGGELEATQTVPTKGTGVDALAKARAVKAAKAAARKAAAESINSIQLALAAEKVEDHASFGEIKEVRRIMPTREEYVRVEIPAADLFDHTHPGVQLNRHKFEPGKTYLLRGDVALEVKTRLAMFHDEQVRLLRPNADRKALADVNRGSQWTSRGGNAITPLGRLEDIPTAADERIYTIDFD